MRLSFRSIILCLFLLSLAAFAIYGHVQVMPVREDYVGPLAMVDRLFDLLLAASIVGVAFCVGRKIARLLGLSPANLAEEFSISALLGVGTIGTSLLLLGLGGLLVWPAMAALFVLFLTLTHREFLRLVAVLKAALASATATKTRLLLTAAFLLVVAVMVLRTLSPPQAPDETIYHLSIPKLFIQKGRVYPVLDSFYGNLTLLVQMVYTVCLILKAEIAAKLLSLFIAIVTAFAIYGFCLRLLTRRAAVTALFSFLGTAMLVEVATTSRVDVSLAGMLFASAYAMVVYFVTKQTGWLYASAIFAGFGFAIKYSAGVFIPLLAVMYLAESFLRKDLSFLTTIRRGLVYSALLLLVISPWMLKNYVWFKNPIYPFRTGEVAEFEAGQVRFFNDEDNRKIDEQYQRARAEMPGMVTQREGELSYAASRRTKHEPLRFWEYFTRPADYNTGEPLGFPNYLFLMFPLVLFIRPPRWLIWFTFISVAFFVGTAQTNYVGRMLLPVYPLLTVISAFVLTELAARADFKGRFRSRPPKAIALPAVALVVTVGFTTLVSLVQFNQHNEEYFITGEISRNQFLSYLYYYPPTRFINTRTPEGSCVLMIGAMNCYDMERDYIAEANWDSTEWRRLLSRNKTIERVYEDLKLRGVTHVWVAYGYFGYVASQDRADFPDISGPAPKTGPDWHRQLRNWATVDLFRSKYLDELYSDNFGNSIYRIR